MRYHRFYRSLVLQLSIFCMFLSCIRWEHCLSAEIFNDDPTKMISLSTDFDSVSIYWTPYCIRCTLCSVCNELLLTLSLRINGVVWLYPQIDIGIGYSRFVPFPYDVGSECPHFSWWSACCSSRTSQLLWPQSILSPFTFLTVRSLGQQPSVHCECSRTQQKRLELERACW